MKIKELFKQKQSDLQKYKPVTIAFLGDSVTQGCFECYLTSPTTLDTVFEPKNAYSTRLKELLGILYPSVQVNIINSGISGDNAPGGLARLERDVLSYQPDFVVVSFGLNDSAKDLQGLQEYKDALAGIFSKLNENGVETLFVTQNYNATHVSPHLKDELFLAYAKEFERRHKEKILHKYFDAAREVCAEYNVRVCDLFTIWEKMENAGVNVTELLSNKFNHPIREYHYYMAIKILENMLD